MAPFRRTYARKDLISKKNEIRNVLIDNERKDNKKRKDGDLHERSKGKVNRYMQAKKVKNNFPCDWWVSIYYQNAVEYLAYE